MTDQTSPRPDGGTPLQDLRVTELGQLLAGPFCGQLLGDFGAEVIKVEDPGQGDPMRQWGREKPHGMSLWWPVVARNKKSVTANLRDPRGQDLVRRLAERSDVLLENFRPGTLERWGLGYDVLSAINPRLVLAIRAFIARHRLDVRELVAHHRHPWVVLPLDHPEDVVALGLEELGEVLSVLSGDPGDEGSGHGARV